MYDDFPSDNYAIFEELYLERDELLDKAPGPRIRGELARKASEVNISNGEILTGWADDIKLGVMRETGLDDSDIELVPVGDWKQGTAAILIIDIEDSEPLLLKVYDSSDIRLQLPAWLVSVMRFKKSEKRLTNRDAAVSLLSGVINKVLL